MSSGSFLLEPAVPLIFLEKYDEILNYFCTDISIDVFIQKTLNRLLDVEKLLTTHRL